MRVFQSEANDTDAKAARSEMRGKLINVLGNVADLVANYDQLDKTAGALYKVTAVSDEVSDDGKVSQQLLTKFSTTHNIRTYTCTIIVHV